MLKGLGRDVTVLRRGKLQPRKGSTAGSSRTDGSDTNSLNFLLNRLFQEGYQRLCFSVRGMVPCQVLGLTYNVSILEDGVVELLITALVHHAVPPMPRHMKEGGRSRSVSAESQAQSQLGSSFGSPTPLLTAAARSELNSSRDREKERDSRKDSVASG